MGADQLRLVFMPPSDIVAATKACETSVFHDRYQVSSEQMAADYGPYDDVSAWLSVIDGSGDVVAGCRMIPPNPKGLKSVADASRPPWSLDGPRVMAATRMDPARTWDVATLFRRPGRPAAPITAALSHGVIMALRHNGGHAFVAILDSVARAMLQRAFGLRMHIMPGASRQMFMNTPNDPTYVFLHDLLENSRRVNPDGYRMYEHGIGLDGIDLPSPAEFQITHQTLDVRDPHHVALPRQHSHGEGVARTG